MPSCPALLTLGLPVVQVARVHYPGLPSHPHHARIQGVYAGCGGVLAVELKGGVVAAEAMMAVSCCCWCLAKGLRLGRWGWRSGQGSIADMFCWTGGRGLVMGQAGWVGGWVGG